MRKLVFFIFITSSLFSQEKKETPRHSYNLQIDYVLTNVIEKGDVGHLVTGNTEGFLLSWNKQSSGKERWQQRFNYPDIGFSIGYLNFNNESLGKLFSINTHYNFYLLQRTAKNQLILGIGTGLAYNTNPYHKIYNNKNIALGSHFSTTSFVKFSYSRENIFNNIGLQTGLFFVHASNGSTKSPNTGINNAGITLGLNYNLNSIPKEFMVFLEDNDKKTKEQIHFNVSLLFGVNEPDFIGSEDVFPFYILSGYLDKKLNNISTLQFGTELNFHYYIKELIKKNYAANQELANTDYYDWKRVSIFVGHELLINKSAIISQLGFYIYSPYKNHSIFYERIGYKRYIKKSYFASLSVKAHFFNAEALEIGVGYRF